MIVVLKNCIGIWFWIWTVPGIAVIVKVNEPSPIAAGISRRGRSARRKSVRDNGKTAKTTTKSDTPP